MWGDLWEELDMIKPPYRVSIVGGGGKTTTLHRLVDSAASTGRRIVFGTTTHIQRPAHVPVLDGRDPAAVLAWLDAGRPVCLGLPDPQNGKKLVSPGDEIWAAAAQWADGIVVEADGAKMLPVKVPAGHEPVLLPGEGYVLAVAGLCALGKPLSQICFRSELAARLLGIPEEEPLSPEGLARILVSPQGQGKGVVAVERYRIILNQRDVAPHKEALAVADWIHHFSPQVQVFLASMAGEEIERV